MADRTLTTQRAERLPEEDDLAVTCGARWGGRTPCTHPAVLVPVAGCIHEHITQRPACRMHADELIEGRLVCRACREIDGHDCVLHILTKAAS